MKNKFLSAIAAIATCLSINSANAQDVLTGDTRLACEAILCLSSGTRPHECSTSIKRYFSIHKRKLSDTLKARLNFLKLCPVSNQTPEMQALVNALSNGAGRCDAQSLNRSLVMWRRDEAAIISDKMPNYCTAYTDHTYTDFSDTMPRYVGLPERCGYWVEAVDYDLELARYANNRNRQRDACRPGFYQ